MAKYRLVEFSDGTFGVETYRGFFGCFKRYVDLQHTGFTWVVGDKWFEDCQGTYEQAENVFKTIAKPKVKVVRNLLTS